MVDSSIQLLKIAVACFSPGAGAADVDSHGALLFSAVADTCGRAGGMGLKLQAAQSARRGTLPH